MNKYKVTFKENKKYNPYTRTVVVEANNDIVARQLIVSEFGSWSRQFNPELKKYIKLPSNRIEIITVEEANNATRKSV